MTRSRKRLFLTVFLVVFLGGLGVSGASALWSMQTHATVQVATGTWGVSPAPTPTPPASPTPTPTPTPTIPVPTNQPWQWTSDPALEVVQVSKGSPVTVTLRWAAPVGQTVTQYVVDVPGSANVSVQSGQRQAVITVPNGNSCYPVRLYAVTAMGRSQVIERTVTFHPGGDGTATIGLTARCW
jgi:hypothetical protein